MVEFFISYGHIDKVYNKLYLSLVYLIIFIGINIFWNFYECNKLSFYIENFGISIGQICSFFVRTIMKSIEKNDIIYIKKYIKKSFVKDYSLLLVFNIIFGVANILKVYIANDPKDLNNINIDLFIYSSINLILMALGVFISMRYKSYKHHIISLIIFTILSVVNDIIIKNFNHQNYKTVLINLFIIISKIMLFCYVKYLNISKDYYYIDTLFIMGFFNLIIIIISLSTNIIANKINNDNNIIYEFYNYYKEYGLKNIILIFIFCLIVEGFLGYIFQFATFYYFNPTFLMSTYEASKIPSMLIKIGGIYRWIILAISILQIISLLLYTEILEYNFCSLKEYTIYTITARGPYIDPYNDDFNRDISDDEDDKKIELEGIEYVK